MAASAAIPRSLLGKFLACCSRVHSPARMFSTTTTRLTGMTSLRHDHHHHLSASLNLTDIRTRIDHSIPMLRSTTQWRLLSSEANTNSTKTFAFSDSDDDDDVDAKRKTQKQTIDKSKLPPPYDPFSKKPVIEEPKNPKDLQEVFHKMRSEGLINHAIKMFDGLSKDGLTHEAMELFAQIKDKGNMPDVVAHTAVVEAYASAGQSKQALKVYMRMLACGVKPNAYTYTVLIKGLAQDLKLADAKKYFVEMMDKGMRPNAGTYTAVFEAFAREQKIEEGMEFLEQIKAKGFKPDEKAVREHLSKRGQREQGHQSFPLHLFLRLTTKREADARILTSDGSRIPVHTSVRASVSSVLEKILDRPQNHRNSEKIVPILSIPSDAVLAFVRSVPRV